MKKIYSDNVGRYYTMAPVMTATFESELVQKACNEIVQVIFTDIDMHDFADDVTGGQKKLRRIIFDVCAKHALPRVPKNHEILSIAAEKNHYHTIDNDAFQILRQILIKKPAKTASGVAVVAIMPKPFACPHGRCTYCPGGPESNTPNSYTGTEPPAMDAIAHKYAPIPQICTKLEQLRAFGHDISKTEIVIVGGTFLFMPASYRHDYVKSCYDALNGVVSDTLRHAQQKNEQAAVRNVGFTIETKPDYCKRPHIDAMLEYGVTRVEIGVQSLRDDVYRMVNRGHTYADVVESFQLAKDAGYKITAHMMPGLPTMTPADDIADFAKLYDDSDLRPDMLKIYPSLVIKGTPLYDEYVAGRYTPYSDHDMVEVLVKAKARIPKWVRIMRVQREIPPSQIVAGPKQGNLRQIVRDVLKKRGTPCRCIRCREAGLSADGENNNVSPPKINELNLDVVYYDSSGGREAFVSYEDDLDRIYGFVRLRRPSNNAHRPEVIGGSDKISDDSYHDNEVATCIVRELHVYGPIVGVGVNSVAGTVSEHATALVTAAPNSKNHIQHSGLGRRLMSAAEDIARDKFGAQRLLVISAVGTRQYYRKLGYSLYGPYMSKDLS